MLRRGRAWITGSTCLLINITDTRGNFGVLRMDAWWLGLMLWQWLKLIHGIRQMLWNWSILPSIFLVWSGPPMKKYMRVYSSIWGQLSPDLCGPYYILWQLNPQLSQFKFQVAWKYLGPTCRREGIFTEIYGILYQIKVNAHKFKGFW